MKNLKQAVDQRRANGLYRQNRIVENGQDLVQIVDGRPLLNFCSNDYLGLAKHPTVRQALVDGSTIYGTGGGAAHLVNGHSRAHDDLEKALAEHVGKESALLFSTGYMANLGVIAALLSKGDHLIQDRLNHASLLDAAPLSGARLHRYLHNDMHSLQNKLDKIHSGEKLIAVDSVFSMDGDAADVTALSAIASSNDAWLMLDEAHSLGVLGPQGRGISTADTPIVMATLGKAMGTAGAFIAGDKDLIEYLIQFARPYIYTTASPPAIACATLASLKLCQNEQWRRDKIHDLHQQLNDGLQALGFECLPSDSAIQAVICGDAQTALDWSQQLEDLGFWLAAIRPPTVPEGTARLRITLNANQNPEHIDALLNAFALIRDHNASASR